MKAKNIRIQELHDAKTDGCTNGDIAQFPWLFFLRSENAEKILFSLILFWWPVNQYFSFKLPLKINKVLF